MRSHVCCSCSSALLVVRDGGSDVSQHFCRLRFRRRRLADFYGVTIGIAAPFQTMMIVQLVVVVMPPVAASWCLRSRPIRAVDLRPNEPGFVADCCGCVFCFVVVDSCRWLALRDQLSIAFVSTVSPLEFGPIISLAFKRWGDGADKCSRRLVDLTLKG